MDVLAAALAGVVLGALLGAAAVLLRQRASRVEQPRPVPGALPAGVAEVLAVLRSATVVLDVADGVVRASPPAYAFGLVRGHDLVHAELREMARCARRTGRTQEAELELPRGLAGRGRLVVHARVAPLGEEHVLLLVEDRTEARRVEEVRRDFVANVSHELKTPVGAVSLLSEAVTDAADDPDAVRHFAAQMHRESQRLARLVQEIIDLSRVQVADLLQEPQRVAVDEVVAEAVDRSRLGAHARGIELAVGGERGAVVYGDRDLLVTAVRNLVDNAVSYSPEGSRVAVGVHRGGGLVEVVVSDQGIGIPADDLDRVFERFYRVDAARSRATGGTGLGLSIVKHVATNHGGEVAVWSVEGQGSTFTIRLPDPQAQPSDPAPDRPAAGSDAERAGASP